MDITNEDTLVKVMGDICNDVIEKVSVKILNKLKETIKRDTYESHSPNVVYEPSMEFMNAWEWKPVQKAVKSLSTELFYHWQTMKTDPKTYKHIDYVSMQDNREKLADILNINGLEPGNPIAVFRYSFWNNFIADMTFGGEIMTMFDKEFASYGIKR